MRKDHAVNQEARTLVDGVDEQSLASHPALQRRRLLQTAAASICTGALGSGLAFATTDAHGQTPALDKTGGSRSATALPASPPIKPPRLQPGQTIGLVAPSGAMPERLPLEVAFE